MVFDSGEWANYMLQAEEATQTYKEILNNQGTEIPPRRLPNIVKRVARNSFKEGESNGQLQEYQRSEQVELRQSLQNLLNKAKRFMDNPTCNDFTQDIQYAEWCIEHLKPPIKQTEDYVALLFLKKGGGKRRFG